jgi:hypothetical protein
LTSASEEGPLKNLPKEKSLFDVTVIDECSQVKMTLLYFSFQAYFFSYQFQSTKNRGFKEDSWSTIWDGVD